MFPLPARSFWKGWKMTEPNQFSHTDLLAARELVKTKLTPAFHRAIDRGEFDRDGIGLMDSAKAEVIRRRGTEEQETAE